MRPASRGAGGARGGGVFGREGVGGRRGRAGGRLRFRRCDRQAGRRRARGRRFCRSGSGLERPCPLVARCGGGAGWRRELHGGSGRASRGSPPGQYGSLIYALPGLPNLPCVTMTRNGRSMEPEKRRFKRKRTDQLVYAEFGPENGSILLNLSEGGCSFQSMAPVREERLRFSVSVGDGRKLEGDGQMVWSDTSKKTGGLRFLLPSKWLGGQVGACMEGRVVHDCRHTG